LVCKGCLVLWVHKETRDLQEIQEQMESLELQVPEDHLVLMVLWDSLE
jgi:hypothetical protein